jgi:hypothetical protein
MATCGIRTSGASGAESPLDKTFLAPDVSYLRFRAEGGSRADCIGGVSSDLVARTLRWLA